MFRESNQELNKHTPNIGFYVYVYTWIRNKECFLVTDSYHAFAVSVQTCLHINGMNN